MDNFEKIVSGNAKFQSYFFLALFLAAIFVSFLVLKPFIIPFILAIVFAVSFKHFYFKILNFFGKREALSSLVTVFLILLLILTPLALIGMKVFSQASQVYVSLDANGSGFIGSIKDFSQQAINNLFDYFNLGDSTQIFSADLDKYLKQGTSWILSNFSSIFSSFSFFIFNIAIFIIMLYYLFKYGVVLKRLAVKLSPLPNQKDSKIIERFEKAINSIMKGSIIIALIQGIIAGLGFTIFGLPQPALWGSLAAISALIPGVGTSLILVPAIIYLGVFGTLPDALGLLIWGALAVGLVDNFLAPRLLSQGSKIHPFLIFLSVLGGLIFFGPIGFLVGPLSLSLLLSLFEIYFLDVSPS